MAASCTNGAALGRRGFSRAGVLVPVVGGGGRTATLSSSPRPSITAAPRLTKKIASAAATRRRAIDDGTHAFLLAPPPRDHVGLGPRAGSPKVSVRASASRTHGSPSGTVSVEG